MAHRLLLDTSSLMYRAYFGLPTSIKDGEGRPVNAVHGYLDMTARLLTSRAPDQIVHVYDDVYVPEPRAQAYPPYKAHRPPDPEGLPEQFTLLEDVLEAFGAERARRRRLGSRRRHRLPLRVGGDRRRHRDRHRRPRPAPACPRRRPDRARAVHRQGRH